MKLQVAGYLPNSRVNGEGTRCVLFVSGCRHKCSGCHNEAMQNYNYGDSIDINDILDKIKDDLYFASGVTFSGGEPFDKPKELAILSHELKKSNINIWAYSGYRYEEIIKDPDKFELLFNVDVLVDGKWMESQKSNAKYKGSDNQRIIDVKESFKQNKIILWEEK